jgi:hypothetical protein
LGGKEMLELMKEVITGTNRIYNKFLYCEIEARRMSGEMNTSLGNGFSNLIFMKFICHELGLDCIGVVEGDDGLFVFVGKSPQSEDFIKYGFDIKLERYTEISRASFCGNLFDEKDLSIITDPYDAMACFGWTSQRYARASKNTLRLLLKSKALSLAHQYPGCPILGAFSQYVLRCLRSYDIKAFSLRRRDVSLWEREQLQESLNFLGKNKYESLYQEPGDRTRLLFEELYGIGVEEQKSIERALGKLAVLVPLYIPGLVEHAPACYRDYFQTYVITVPNTKAIENQYFLNGVLT